MRRTVCLQGSTESHVGLPRSAQCTQRAARRGLTLIELVVATGIASLLIVAVFRLLDSGFRLWNHGETKRLLVEQSSALSQLLARDVRSVHVGRKGDMLAEWVAFDTDGDGLREILWPRMRIVRQASAAEVARLESSPADLVAFGLAPPAGEASTPESKVGDAARRDDAEAQRLDAERTVHRRSLGPALVEVVWCVLPAGKQRDERCEGVLWRGMRLVADRDSESFFSPGFFNGAGLPPAGRLEEVTGGILWCGTAFATQTTLLDATQPDGGWRIGHDLGHAAASWDAYSGGRPNADVHEWNEPGAGMPAPGLLPSLPRRVRFELEFERRADRKRRTRTVDEVDATVGSFDVQNGERIPASGSYLRIGSEWMRVTSKDGDRIHVQRGQRSTNRALHPPGEMVHWGVTVVCDVSVEQFQDDWSMR